MTVKALLGDRLSEEDEYLLSKGIATGYQACDIFMRSCTVLDSFYPGITHRGYLLGIFAQYGLDRMAASSKKFFSSVKPNTINNHFHCHFEFPSRVHITASYNGKHADRRGRKAVYRGLLAKFNGPDLFESQADKPNVTLDDPNAPLYVHLFHGGWVKPEAIVLAIPDCNQKTYSLTTHALSIVEPDPVAAEQVNEAIQFTIRDQQNDDEQSNKGSA